MVQTNPFIIEGYLSPEHFCDRVEETALLTRHLTNRCNVALIAPRRLGKSGLIHNCFYQKEIREQYHCIYIDIYLCILWFQASHDGYDVHRASTTIPS